MRIQTIIHAPFEKLGIIETWAKNKDHTLAITHHYQGEPLPDASEFDFLVIMGGPQSPLKMDIYPYLEGEIRLAKQTIQANKPVLGICLGAQLIGESLGAKTERSPNKEIGVYPIHLTQDGAKDTLFKNFPSSFDVMHWHNDMPGLPTGCEILAYSEGCPRQVIRFNNLTYGLQCHMEMSTKEVQGMVEHCEADLKPGKYVQSVEKLLSNNMEAINHKMMLIMEHLASHK